MGQIHIREVDRVNKLSNFFIRRADSEMQVGRIVFASSTPSAPGTWVECQGQVFDKTAYPELYSQIGDIKAIPKFTLKSTIPYSGYGVAIINSLYVIGAIRGVYTSPDGVTWTYKYLGIASDWLRKVKVVNGICVCLSTSSFIKISTDGLTWTSITVPVNDRPMMDITYCSNLGKYVILSTNNYGATSSNCTTWTGMQTGLYDNISSMCSSPDLFVGTTSTGLQTSSNGTTWTPRASNFSASYIYCSAYGNGSFVAAGSVSTIVKSADGITWSLANSINSPSDISTMAFGNGMFIAAGAKNNMQASYNGTDWMFISGRGTQNFTNSCFNENRFAFLGSGGMLVSEPFNPATQFMIPDYSNSQQAIVLDKKAYIRIA